MSRHESDEDDIVAASNRLANLSVFEDRSPLKAIPPDSPRVKASVTSHPSAADKPSVRESLKLKSSGSELEYDKDTEDKLRFNKLVKKAKHLAQEGKVQEALQLNKEALQIHHHEKLAKRIAKMEEYLKNYGDEEGDEEDGGMVQLGRDTGFYMHKDLNAKIYNHQKQGVLWLWGLHKKNKGGILGDDMGLGKTIQIIAFLSGLFDMDRVKNVMIVLPVSVMVNWEKEFQKWAPGIAVHSFHGTSKRERERTLDRVQRRGGVLLTTYGMVLTSWEQLTNRDGRDFVWDYVILDEGHKIKNPSKTTKAIHGVAAKHRLILTGTPIQNNLRELWTLFDYVHQGTLLGTLRTFKLEFEGPIIRARERDATGGEKRLGLEMAESLKNIIDPYFLRRTKASVKESEKKASKEGDPHFKSIKMPTMMFKNDFVVWLFLSDTQLNIYRDFLELDSVKELLMSSKSPLVALNVLKKICDHPRLLSLRACHQLGMHGHEMGEDELDLPSSMESAVTKIEAIEDSVLVGEAGKMGVLITLVDHLREEGHRSLIFSQSRKMLDIIQKVLRNRGHKAMRLDGTVRGLMERDELVQKFQKNSSYSVFLLTTQVGGVGLTLTAADRVIIYDPSWNPATDAQAVDRAFRIGQTKNVVIYRLITCGTVEEKIYRRQVFKDSITRQTTGKAKDPYRYFTKQELKELFQLEEPRFSNTQRQLEEMHGLDRRRDPDLDTHIAFLHSLDIFGISDHDLMFSQESPEDELEEEEAPVQNMPAVHTQHADYIKHRVQKAKEIIERESSVPGSMEERMKSGFPATSVYSQPENRALMNGVPVFQPNLADNNRLMLNRPGGGVSVFKPSAADSSRPILNRPPARPPQVFLVHPPKPAQQGVQSQCTYEAISTSNGSSTSDPIDLTVDEEDKGKGAATKITSANSSSSALDSQSAPVGETTEKEEIVLPRIEKRKKDHSLKNTSPKAVEEAPAVKESPTSPVAVLEAGTDSPSSPQSVPQSSTPAAKKPQQNPVTPKGRSHRVVEEELIISPNSYTPLLMTRKKRQRMSDSPVAKLEKALAESFLVADSPDIISSNPTATPESNAGEKSQEASNEIASFLAEDDLEAIEESFVEESESPSTASGEFESERAIPVAVVEHGDVSQETDDSPVAVKPNRRRSVCRRVAIVESSEDEMEDEENKENLHPSFSSTSPRNKHRDDEEDEEKENVNEDESEDAEEVEEIDSEDEMGEEEEEEGSTGRGTDEEANGSVVVYDESVREDDEQEEEREEEEEVAEEDAINRLREILTNAKLFYKQKRYSEALEKCEAAMNILPDPQIEAMIEKIKGKMQAL